jgi:hypothetical protein
METSPHELEKVSRELGYAYGTVLIKTESVAQPKDFLYGHRDLADAYLGTDKPYHETKTTFYQEDELNTAIIPQYSPSRNEIVQKSFTYKYERSGIAQKVAWLGTAALAFVGVEVATTSTPVAAVGAALGFSAVSALNPLRNKRNRHKFYVRKEHELQAIKSNVQNPEKTITLFNRAETLLLADIQSDAFLALEIPISGHNDNLLPAKDILDWLIRQPATRYSVSEYELEAPPAFNNAQPATKLRAHGIIAAFDRSFWGMYLQFKNPYNPYRTRIIDGPAIEAAADSFKANRKVMATTFGITFDHTDMPIDGYAFVSDKDKQALRRRYGKDWQDARVSVVHLPAGKIVTDLLTNDRNPTSFWHQIEPDVLSLSKNYEERETLLRNTMHIYNRQERAGVPSQTDKTDISKIETQVQALNAAYTTTLLGIIGAALLRNRTTRYESMRSELLSSMQSIAGAEDQYGAMQLFDVGIDGLTKHLDPDSEAAIRVSSELREFLTKAMPYINGSETVFNQFYNGMALKFPELKLETKNV